MHPFHITPLRLAAAILLGSLTFAGVGSAAGIGLSSKKLFSWSQTLTKGTCAPVESDALIDQANPNANFGNPSAETIQSKNNGNSYALIGFNPAASLCSVPTTGGADSAVLTLTVTGTAHGADTISAYPITSAWNVSTVTWNTQPSFGSTPDFTFSGTGTHTFTVTASIDNGIKTGAFNGWMLVDTTGTNNATTVVAGHSSTQTPSIALSYEK